MLAGAAWLAGDVWSALVYAHRGPLVHALLTFPTGRTRSPLIVVVIAVGVRRRAGPRVARAAVDDDRADGRRRGRGGVAVGGRSRARAAHARWSRWRARRCSPAPLVLAAIGRLTGSDTDDARHLDLRRRDRPDGGRTRRRSPLGPLGARGGHRARRRSRRPPGASGPAGRLARTVGDPGPRDRLPRRRRSGSTRPDSRCGCPSRGERDSGWSPSWRTAARRWQRSCTTPPRCATPRWRSRSPPPCGWSWPTCGSRPRTPPACARSRRLADGSSRPATSSAARLREQLRGGAEQTLAEVSRELAAIADEPPGRQRARRSHALVDELDAARDDLARFAQGVHPQGAHRARPHRGARRAREPGGCPGRAGRAVAHASPAPQEAAAYFVCSEALANVAKYAEASRARSRSRGSAHGWSCRSPTTATAARIRRAAPGCADWPTASRPSAAGCRSRARSGPAPGSRPSCRSRRRRERPRRARRADAPWVAAAALVVVAAVTVAIVRREPELSLAGDSGAALAAELLAAVLLVAAAVATWRAGVVFPVLLAATALAWLATEWNTPGRRSRVHAGAPPVRRVAAAAGRGGTARAGRAADSTDRPPSCWPWRSAAGVGVLGLASAAVFDPTAQGCAQCPANLLLIADAPGLWALARPGGTRADGGLDGGVRPARDSPGSSAPRRRGDAGRHRSWSRRSQRSCCSAPTPCTASDRGFVSNDPTDRALRLAEAGGARAGRRRRGTRTAARPANPGALARLVLDIGAAPAPGELRAWLADSLGDPTLALLYRLESGEWIDAEGRETSLPRRRRARSDASARRRGGRYSLSSTGPGCSTTPRSSPSW